MYEGVPQKIESFLSGGIYMENPKSIILAYLLSFKIIFSSFISL